MRQIEKFIVLDTETAGGLEFPLAYDLGLVVMDRTGRVYEEKSLVIYNIYSKRDLMESAYYAEKLPSYEEQLKNGCRKMVRLYTAKKLIAELMEKYHITTVYAYNMGFDKRALNNTEKFTTKSKYKEFFPENTEFRCIWNMACQVLLARKSYIKFALDNGYYSEKGNIFTTAECCYRYITNNLNFIEEHQGIDDVRIEAEILLKCFKQHKKMDTRPNSGCWQRVQTKRKELGM